MKTRKALVCIAGVLFLLAMVPFVSHSEVPQQINYQGYLTDSGGNPLNATATMDFDIYDAATDDGNLLWGESQTVNVVNGNYSVEIGQNPTGNPFPVNLFEGSRYLELTVNGETLTPRLHLTCSPFAMKAADADSLEGQSASEFALEGHVHGWGEITGIPSGFADGIDNTGITSETDPTVLASVKNGVSWGEIQAMPAGFADGVDNTGGIETETDPTVLASVKNGVSWGEIQAMPAGFADGVDNTGITSETDPQVGANVLNRVPKWNGSSLSVGTMYDYNSKIGIGTSIPDTLLEIAGNDVSMKGQLQITDTGGDDSFMSFYAGSTFKSHFGYVNGLAHWGTQDGSNLAITGGNVGIGTTIPGQKLHIVGNSPRILVEGTSGNPELNFKNSNDPATEAWALYKEYNSNDFRFFQNGDKMTIQSLTGNVGIGTSNPDHKLHVVGLSQFEVGGGSIAITTPGGNPGLIAFSDNGHRRDITYNDDYMDITVSNSSSAPPSANGIRIFENGHVAVKVLEIHGADLSEQYTVRGTHSSMLPTPGKVVSIDPENPGDLVVSHAAYDRKVAGIISGAGDIPIGMLMGKEGREPDGKSPVALTGRVYCLVDASNGSIEPGDLLTTSDTPGHAMKVTDYGNAQGAILGKAMTSLGEGRGLVLVLVTLQ